MNLALPSRADVAQVAVTLAAGLAGAGLFYAARLPGGLITGAMVAVAAVGLMGVRVGLPAVLGHVILTLLGLAIGGLVSPELLRNVAAYPLTIAALALATFCATFASSFYLQRIHGWDRTSAWLAGSPGALSQIVALATERKADVAGIAVVQVLRVMILTAGVPLLIATSGAAGFASPQLSAPPASALALALLAASGVLTALTLRWLNFPASWMFGAMLASSVLHGAGVVHGTLPLWAYLGALIGVGALIGTRFGKIGPRTIASHVFAALGSFGAAIAVSAAFVALLLVTTTARPGDLVVAFAPGAMDAMLALALTLHIDPIFVGAHHLARFIYVSIATPGIIHLFGRQDDIDD